MRTLKVLSTALLLIPGQLAAQQTPSKNKLNLGFYLSPEYNQELSRMMPDKGNYSYSFSTGLSIKYLLSKNVAMISGLGFGLKRSRNIPDASRFVDKIYKDTGDWETTIRPHEVLSSSEIFYEIQIPLLVQVNVWENKFFVTSGLEASRCLYHNVKSQTRLTGNDEMINTATRLRGDGNALAIVAGLGMNVKAFKTMDLAIEPIVKLYPGLGSYNDMLSTFGLKTSWYFIH